MRGDLDQAIVHFQKALELDPGRFEALGNLGLALLDQGLVAEAISCHRHAMTRSPELARAHSNLLYTLHFSPQHDSAAIWDEHRRWDERHARPLAQSIRPHQNQRSPDRRLRVGYISPDFRGHVVRHNLLPLFREHDHERFDIVCYADVAEPDDVTERLRAGADTWREVIGLTDEQVAEQIRQDRIDLLVDLSLHSGNRLLVFARKPAPVQATFAGYPGTTGLSTIDYRLTDPYLDPPGRNDRYYSEESIRLPDSFWCYDPPADAPPVATLPARQKGLVTFGCLNKLCKVNDGLLRLWSAVLGAVERSRLILMAPAGSSRGRIRALLEQNEIAPDRVSFVGRQPRKQYFEMYQQIDLGLDTFPYNGHTTSLDSFWMGVPVITLVGQTAVGRAGLSQLTNLGLPELAAATPEEFVNTACQWAADQPRLAALRAGLRDRMQSSPLMDAPRFARNVEAAYRAMWQRWCQK